MSTHIKLVAPKLNIDVSAPRWVKTTFPSIIKSIYEGFNGVLGQYSAQINSLKAEIKNLKSEHEVQIKSLQEELKIRDAEIKSQQCAIINTNNSVTKNESYSRRANLIFTLQISKTDNRKCDEIIVNDIFTNKLHLNDAKNISFVRCHYLFAPKAVSNTMSQVTIIARFDSFSQRMMVWNKRRNLPKGVYISEDYPGPIAAIRNKYKPILKAASKHTEYQRCITMKYDKLVFQSKAYAHDEMQNLPEAINPKTLSQVQNDHTLVFGGVNSDYNELSNYYKCSFTYENKSYSCVEQAFQHAKCIKFSDIKSDAMIMRESLPSEMKKLGNTVNGFKEDIWNEVRDDIMRAIIHEKFSQNKQLAAVLCGTKDKVIGESIVADRYWGTGISINSPNALSQGDWHFNRLGRILMSERDILKVQPASKK